MSRSLRIRVNLPLQDIERGAGHAVQLGGLEPWRALGNGEDGAEVIGARRLAKPGYRCALAELRHDLIGTPLHCFHCLDIAERHRALYVGQLLFRVSNLCCQRGALVQQAGFSDQSFGQSP